MSATQPLTPIQEACIARIKARIQQALLGEATIVERKTGDTLMVGLRCSACGYTVEHETEPRLELQTWLVIEEAAHQHWKPRLSRPLGPL